jgi:predicted dehydrogenase
MGRFLFSNISRRFVNAIRENKVIDPSFKEGVETQRVLDAMLESDKKREWISVK